MDKAIKCTVIASIIIGCFILMGFLILKNNMPRYQFLQTEYDDKDGTTHISSVVCDMVTGDKYESSLFIVGAGAGAGRNVSIGNAQKMIKTIKRQKEVFGKKTFTIEEWKDAKAARGWE